MTIHEDGREPLGGTRLYDLLVKAGIELLIGLPGTQTLPLDRIVAERDEIRYVMARHETSIPHIAWGYYEACGTPAATLTVPGPGDTNAMHGLKNAAEDCVPIVHVSADVDPEERGKSPIHEIPPETYDTVVKENFVVGSRRHLSEQVARAIDAATTSPYGPVRVGVPRRVLESSVPPEHVTVEGARVTHRNESAYNETLEALRDAERPLVYVGGGARRSPSGPEAVAELARRLDAPVLSTYKGKGVFPEDDPRFLGVSAKHLPASAETVLAAADVVLALGTDFDGVTTAEWSLPMGDFLVHVNIDVDEMDRAYESDVAIVADVATAVERLLAGLDGVDPAIGTWNGSDVATAARSEFDARIEQRGLLVDDPIKTPGALSTIRDVLPRDAVITTDVGGFRLWSKQVLETYGHREYVTAGSWAGMGVGLPAAIGAKIARPERDVVALTGDGSLMMSLTELHTAVEQDLPVCVIVFNNSDYGVISQSWTTDDCPDGRRFAWTSPEFDEIAEGFGCRGVSVSTRNELRRALEEALDDDRPVLIDVEIPTDEPTVVDVADFEPSLSLR